MKFFISMMLLISFHTYAQKEPSGHYVILLNGGHDVSSNNPRYLENIRAMYEAYRENDVASDKITVLYGSGKVEDTGSQNPFSSFGGPATFTPLFTTSGSGSGGYGYPPPGSGGGFKAIQGGFGLGSAGGMAGSAQPFTTGGMAGSAQPSTTGGYVGGAEPASTGGMTGGTGGNVTTQPQASPHTLDYLFNGEKREIDGEAKKAKLREKIRQIKSQLKPGDDISLFITDHGSRNDASDESEINLWGEKISTSELGELLREFPATSKIRIVTNICYGGGLNDLTGKNVCVFANQQKGIPSYSKSIDLDLYGQNFAFALKNKIDFDKDGTPTYLDAHHYATSLDQDQNIPMTSLDWFLNKNKNKILDLKREHKEAEALACIIPEEDSFKDLKVLIEDFDALKSKIAINDENIPGSRKKYLKGNLEKRIQKIQNNESSELLNSLEMKLTGLRKSLEKSATEWDKLTPEQQQNHKKKAILEAQQLKIQIAELEKSKKQSESLNLELDLLRYGDKQMVEEYEQIMGCLDYEY